MDDWNIDVVLSASQKGLGAPPGLSIVVASQRALQVRNATIHVLHYVNRDPLQVNDKRVAPIAGYYSSWKRFAPFLISLYSMHHLTNTYPH